MIITDNLTGEVTEVEEIGVQTRILTDTEKEQLYKNSIVSLIREKYSADDEYAILRKKLANIDTENEFDTYNTYVEECKSKAKIEVYGEVTL